MIGRFIGAILMAAFVGYFAHVFGAIHPDLATFLAAWVGACAGWLTVIVDQYNREKGS